MRHRLLSLWLTLALPLNTANVQVSSPTATTVIAKVVVYRLNVRAGAHISAARRIELKQGDTVTIIGQKKVGVLWLKVQTTNDQAGWLIASFVNLTSGSLKDVPITK